MIERQVTRSTKHDGSVIILRKVLREIKEMKELLKEMVENGR